MKAVAKPKTHQVPTGDQQGDPTARHGRRHPQVADHFLNWLAFILQHRDRTKTAWVLHGVPGTGKGLLTNDILRPIFGTLPDCSTPHGGAERAVQPLHGGTRFLVFVDEVQTKALQQ
jgi:hypothetical protein